MNSQVNNVTPIKTQFSMSFYENELLMLRGLLVAAATKDVRYYLNGLHINNTYITGTDGHRLARFKHGFELPAGTDIIIPTFKIPASTDCIVFNIDTQANTIELATIAKNDGSTITQILQAIDGKYPDVERIIPDISGKHEQATVQINPLLIADVMKALKAKVGVNIHMPNAAGRAFDVYVRKFPAFEFVVMGLRD